MTRCPHTANWLRSSFDQSAARLPSLALVSVTGTPEWTDFNESDPGVSLLELFAFLACGYLLMTRMDLLLERLGLAYRLDPVTGSVQFGDGAQGAVPPRSDGLETRYRYGGGAAGFAAVAALACTAWAVSMWMRWRRACGHGAARTDGG